MQNIEVTPNSSLSSPPHPVHELEILKNLFYSNADKFGSRSSGAALRTFASCVLLVMIISASTFAVQRHRHVATILCFVALGGSIALVAVTRVAEAAVHIAVIAFITQYQLYAYIAHIQVEWWTEMIVFGAVALVLAWENIILYYELFRVPREMPETLRDMAAIDSSGSIHGYFGGAILLVGCFVPLPGAGLFYLSHLRQLFMIMLWTLLAVTEAHKARICKGLIVPHIACKCAPLLYLHPYYWFIVLASVAMNVYMLAAFMGGEMRKRENDNRMRKISAGIDISIVSGNETGQRRVHFADEQGENKKIIETSEEEKIAE